VRDWYVDSFKELRSFPLVRDIGDEAKFTELLRHIYRRHANVVPVMAKVCVGCGLGVDVASCTAVSLRFLCGCVHVLPLPSAAR
jgi:hypothetical protein